MVIRTTLIVEYLQIVAKTCAGTFGLMFEQYASGEIVVGAFSDTETIGTVTVHVGQLSGRRAWVVLESIVVSSTGQQWRQKTVNITELLILLCDWEYENCKRDG